MSALSLPSLALCLIVAACAKAPPPLVASSADEAGYAERYPAVLEAARMGFAADETEAQTTAAEFQKFPDELEKPDWKSVGQVYEEADRAGRGGDFAAGMAEAEAVRRFYSAEKDALRRKVGGSVDHAVKQKQCDVEVYGPVGGGLDRAVEQQLEERLRGRSVAHRTIEDQADALGKSNLEKLETQADRIARVSYLVNVRMPQTQRELDAALADASGVKSALDREAERAAAVQNDPNASKQSKETAEKRAAAVAAAQSRLDAEVEQTRALAEQLEKRLADAKKRYDDGFAALIDAAEEREKTAPAA